MNSQIPLLLGSLSLQLSPNCKALSLLFLNFLQLSIAVLHCLMARLGPVGPCRLSVLSGDWEKEWENLAWGFLQHCLLPSQKATPPISSTLPASTFSSEQGPKT